MSEFKSEEGVVSALDEASGLIDEIGGNAGSKKEKRLKAWRKLAKHFSWNRIADIHRASDLRVRVSGDELSILRAAARQENEATGEARREYRLVIERLTRLEARLLAIDPEFHIESARALREAIAGSSDEDKPLAE